MEGKPLVSFRPKGKESKKNSRVYKEQLDSESRGLKETMPTLGRSQTDTTSRADVVTGDSSKEVELPHRSVIVADPNNVGSVDQGFTRTGKKKVRSISNQPKNRKERTDTADQSDQIVNNYFPENSDCPNPVPSSNVPNPPRAEASDLSQETQNSHPSQTSQQVRSNTAATCGSFEAKIAPPLDSSLSSVNCETPSTSYAESFTSDITDIMDCETDSADIHPKLESVSGQKVTELKQIIVDRIMKDFCSTFYKSEGIRVHAGNHDGDSNPNWDSSSRHSSSYASSTQIHNIQALLRGAGGQGDGFGDDEDNDKNQDRRGNVNFTTELPNTLKLACPYYKRDPFNQALHTSCRGSSWKTVARVK